MGTSARPAPRRRVAAYEWRRRRRDGYHPTPWWDRTWARVIGRVQGPAPAVFLRAVDIRRRVVATLDSVEDALWLGAFDPDDLWVLDERHYATGLELVGRERLAWAEPELNLAGITAWEAALVQAYVPVGGRVVIIGAGAGRELRALLDSGYDAVGYEPNGRLVEAGRATTLGPGEQDRLRTIGRDAFPEGERSDAVLLGWGVYAHVTGRVRRVALLVAAREALTPGGRIMLSFPERASKTAGARVKHVLSSAVRALRRQPRTEVGDVLQPSPRHCFSPAEIAAEVAAAGLELELYVAGSQPHAVARCPPVPRTGGVE